MTKTPVNPSKNPKTKSPLHAPESGFSLLLKFFIVPALIVAVALGIFLFATFAFQHPKTAEQYLRDFKSDSTSRRWQSAYELSRMLNQGDKIQFNEDLRAELVKTFEAAKTDDPKVREYLVLVLGSLKEKSAVPALSEATRDTSTNVRVNSLWALGNIEDPAGGPAALQALLDNDLGVRLMAVGALGSLRYAPARNALESNLGSPDPTLRYNSAVALARLKDNKAEPVLLEMLSLRPTGKKGDEMIQAFKLAGIEGARELNTPLLREQLVSLSKNDPDVKVKAAALEALEK